jgi:hypothetical protein
MVALVVLNIYSLYAYIPLSSLNLVQVLIQTKCYFLMSLFSSNMT